LKVGFLLTRQLIGIGSATGIKISFERGFKKAFSQIGDQGNLILDINHFWCRIKHFRCKLFDLRSYGAKPTPHRK
jgi:hypothetical protein